MSKHISVRALRNLKQAARIGRASTRNKQQRADADKIRLIAKKLINSKSYIAKLTEKLNDGTAHPSIQTTLLAYAWGRPPDDPEEKRAVPVRIVHQFTKPDKPNGSDDESS